MKSLFYYLVAILFFNSSLTYSQWNRLNGPYGGDIYDFAISSVGNFIVAGTSEGVYITSDFGENWIKKEINTTGLYPSVRSVISILGTFYIASQNGVQKTTDNGNNWSVINNGISTPFIYSLDYKFDILQGSTIYAGTENGVFKTTDGGNNWVDKSSGLVNKRVLRVKLLGTTLFAITADSSLYRSTNNGDNWNLVSSIKCVLDKVSPLISLSSGRILLGLKGEIAYSDDAGLNWNKSVIGINASITDFIIVSSTVYAVFSNGTVYKSTNNGQNWSQVSVQGIVDGGSHSINRIAKLSSYYFIGYTYYGVFRSSSLETGWIEKNTGLSNVRVNLIVPMSSTNTIYLGTLQNGVHMLKNDVYTRLNPLDKLKNPVFIDAKYNIITMKTTLYVADYYDGVYKTTDNGANWTRLDGSMTGYLTSAIMTGGAIYQIRSNNVYRSSNEGVDWSIVLTGGIKYKLFSSRFNSNVYVFDYDNGAKRLLVSSNGIDNWTNIWNNLPFATNEMINDLESKGELIVLASNMGLYISTNSGSSWQKVDNTYFNRTNYYVYINDNNIFVANSGGLYLSKDSGANWTFISDNLSTQGIYVCAVYNNDLYIGSFAAGLWKRNYNDLVSVEAEETKISDFNLEQNYPNPFNGETTITFNLPYSSDATLRIYDRLGREVKCIKLTDNEIRGGVYKLDMSEYSSGIYFYKLTTSKSSLTRKMVYIK